MSKIAIHEQVAILMRGTDFGDDQTKEHMQKELHERLIESESTGRPLRVYCGYDPTAPDIHLGHTVTMRKLRQFQELGHEVTFLIGNFTGLIGDPSDRTSARAQQDAERVAENARTYTEQAFKILDPEKTIVRENAEWLSKLTFADVIGLAANFTVQQFLARENFALRYEKGEAIWLHEFFYALMQGYDAVAMETDVQVGGTDQLFNLMAGRKLQEAFGQKPQVCITLPILVGTDGNLRMSKSTGNYVGIDDTPEDKYGKTMSIPDSAMRNWLELVTRWKQEQIDELMGAVEGGELHPMEAKKKLAWEIVSIFDGDEAANGAAAHFERVHQERKLPEDMPTLALDGPTNIVDIIHTAGFASSKSEARRLVQGGAVRLDGKRVPSPNTIIHGLRRGVAHTRLGGKDERGYRPQILDPDRRQVLQVGPLRFVRLEMPEE
jgi:tyrosyl-tRNA synthetase